MNDPTPQSQGATVDYDHVEAQLREALEAPGFGPVASNALVALQSLRAQCAGGPSAQALGDAALRAEEELKLERSRSVDLENDRNLRRQRADEQQQARQAETKRAHDLQQRLDACEAAYALVCKAISPEGAPVGAAAMALGVKLLRKNKNAAQEKLAELEKVHARLRKEHEAYKLLLAGATVGIEELVNGERFVAMDEEIRELRTQLDGAKQTLGLLAQHLADRIDAVFEAKIAQEKRGGDGSPYVERLQKELDTLQGVQVRLGTLQEDASEGVQWEMKDPADGDPFWLGVLGPVRAEIGVCIEWVYEWEIYVGDDDEDGEGSATGTVWVPHDEEGDEQWDYQGVDLAKRRCAAVMAALAAVWREEPEAPEQEAE